MSSNIFKNWSTLAGYRRISRGINRVNQKRTIFYLRILLFLHGSQDRYSSSLHNGLSLAAFRLSWAQTPHWGNGKRQKTGSNRKNIGEQRRAKRAERWPREVERSTVSPPQTVSRLTSLADFFSPPADFFLFFSFSPNAEPSPRLR